MATLEHSCVVTYTMFKDTLRDLSNVPEGAYKDLWVHISQQDQFHANLARRTLIWVALSKEPLKIETLQYGLKLSDSKQESQSLPFEEDDLTEQDTIVSVCFGLIFVSKTHTVEFVHHTAVEFFPQFLEADKTMDAHYVIACASMKYMRVSLPDSSTRSYPLDRFAGLYWGVHAAQSRSQAIQQQILHLLSHVSFLRRGAALLLSALWQSHREVFGKVPPEIDHIEGPHLAAFFGLSDIIKFFSLRGGLDIPSTNLPTWTVLRWAIFGRQGSIIEYLLSESQGAGLDLADKLGNTPLMWAIGRRDALMTARTTNVRGGDLDIGHKLASSSFDWYYDDQIKALESTVKRPTSQEIVMLLARKTRAIDHQNKAHETALCIAAALYDIDVVSVLVQRGAVLDVVDAGGMTPLLRVLQPPNDRLYKSISVAGQAIRVHIGNQITIKSFKPAKDIKHLMPETVVLTLIGSNLEIKDPVRENTALAGSALWIHYRRESPFEQRRRCGLCRLCWQNTADMGPSTAFAMADTHSASK